MGTQEEPARLVVTLGDVTAVLDLARAQHYAAEDPHTGARRGGTEMAALVAFLDAMPRAEGGAERVSSATSTDASRP